MRRALSVCTILTILLLAACAHSRPSHSVDTSHGKAVYDAQCIKCHGAGGAGAAIAPKPLRGEGRRRPAAQIRAFITDPEPPMPKLYPSQMSAADVRDVTAYVESL